jgi:hypothetical protein
MKLRNQPYAPNWERYEEKKIVTVNGTEGHEIKVEMMETN